MSTTQRNSKVKAGVLNAGTDQMETEKDARELRMKKRLARDSQFTRPTDIIAQDFFCLRNQPIPKGKELFPAEWKMQFVDLFYPYAQGGPLYIDMPLTTHEVALCERKMVELRKREFRYTYIKNNENASDGTLRLEGGDPDKIKADQENLRREKF